MPVLFDFMNPDEASHRIGRVLGQPRRCLIRHAFFSQLLVGCAFLLPVVAIAIVLDRRLNSGQWTGAIAVTGLVAILLAALVRAYRVNRTIIRTASSVDQTGDLKDRVTSACEFLESRELDPARQVQIA